jgi:hypothetical protein
MAVRPDSPLLLDATVYADHLMGQLPADIIALVASRVIFHGAPVLAELAITLGTLDRKISTPAPRSSQFSTLYGEFLRNGASLPATKYGSR